MVQLQQLKQFLDLRTHIADLKLTVVIVGRLQRGQEYSESRTVDKGNPMKVKY